MSDYIFKEIDKEKAKAFNEEIKPLLNEYPFIALDECSFYPNQDPRFGYSLKGDRAIARKPGHKGEHYTLLFAISNLKEINPIGDKRNYLIMDNAKIHTAPDKREEAGVPSVEEQMLKKNIEVRFITKYAPMINPAELVFNTLRQQTEKQRHRSYEEMEKSIEKVIKEECKEFRADSLNAMDKETAEMDKDNYLKKYFVRNNELGDDNETNNFIIDQYRENDIPVNEAVRAYNLEKLDESEKDDIRDATTEEKVKNLQKEIRQTRFRKVVRKEATNQAETDFGSEASPAPGSDFIIDQFNKDNITPAEAEIEQERTFIFDFRQVAGAAATATDSDILTYCRKNLTGSQAAALYNGNPQVLGSELRKGTGNDQVEFDGKYYQVTDTVGIIAAKKAKIDDANNKVKLTNAKTAAETAIKGAQKESGKPEITDTELNKHLKEVDQVLEAIATLRKAKEKPSFDATKARTEAITKKKELTDKIDAEKAKEPTKEPPKKEEPTNNEIKEAINNALGIEIQSFLKENLKDKEEEFVKLLDELPGTDKPTGSDEKEKIKNFLASQKAEVVIKVVFRQKLKDEDFQTQIEDEMKNKKNGDEKPLDETFYPKENGKFTQEAMIRYLYEKKTGQSHQFAAKNEERGGSDTSTSGKSH
ncbi:1989_t:CDS:10 [Paraglomus brasilianum]|uniref:1989_t:CDS:1 n=1 Tax=Paraglomus brasilianum TaxID=144538 RepID=A0A9N9C8Q5_9GLOM|nr:1989_t:CDS:10 [Paraglomus brasilianum]